jgi:hypothetical protein
MRSEDLLALAKAKRELAKDLRITAGTLSSEEDQRTFAEHAWCLDREADRLELEAACAVAALLESRVHDQSECRPQ